MQTPIHIDSRFPAMGTTIFTVMSRLAAECGAINLSQGFPDFQAAPALFDAMDRHMRAGRNQYAPMAGMPELRQAIAMPALALTRLASQYKPLPRRRGPCTAATMHTSINSSRHKRCNRHRPHALSPTAYSR